MHNIGEFYNLSKICKFCNFKKIETALGNKKRILNKRQKLFYTCPHLNFLIGFLVFVLAYLPLP